MCCFEEKFLKEIEEASLPMQEEFCQEDSKARFRYLDCVKTYPVFHFGGASGTKVCTLAFQKESSFVQ